MKEDGSAAHKSILFVCLGNICRSPIAEGMFRHIAAQRNLLDQFTIDFAGLGSWHIGHPPDERAQMAMRQRGIDISALRGRRITPADFETFDLILAMDRANRDALLKFAPKEGRDKVRLLDGLRTRICACTKFPIRSSARITGSIMYASLWMRPAAGCWSA